MTKKKLLHKGEQHLIYNMKIWKRKGVFDTLNEITEFFTLVQLMYRLRNINHAISTVRSWIFEYKYENALCFTIE